jgi:hypothetical protein
MNWSSMSQIMKRLGRPRPFLDGRPTPRAYVPAARDRSNPTGDLEPWDNPAAVEGGFWVFQFLERMQYGDPFGATNSN